MKGGLVIRNSENVIAEIGGEGGGSLQSEVAKEHLILE